MGLQQLTIAEREIVLRCLRASVEGPYFDEEEFHSLFGLDREEVAAIADQWPEVDDSEPGVETAIIASFVNLLWYAHDDRKDLHERIGANDAEIERVFKTWRRSFAHPAEESQQ